jgi:hypothetical protein
MQHSYRSCYGKSRSACRRTRDRSRCPAARRSSRRTWPPARTFSHVICQWIPSWTPDARHCSPHLRVLFTHVVIEDFLLVKPDVRHLRLVHGLLCIVPRSVGGQRMAEPTQLLEDNTHPSSTWLDSSLVAGRSELPLDLEEAPAQCCPVKQPLASPQRPASGETSSVWVRLEEAITSPNAAPTHHKTNARSIVCQE